MTHPNLDNLDNLDNLTDAQFLDYHRRYKANLALYHLDVSAAVSKGGGLIDRVASACAFRDVKNRRQRPGRTR